MKKLCLVLFIFGGIVYLQCTRTAIEPEKTVNCTPEFPDKKVTYKDYVNAVLKSYCTSCHNGRGVAPGDFSTYEGVLPYVNAFPIRVLQDNADMPQGNAPLPQKIRDSLAVWIGNCVPEK